MAAKLIKSENEYQQALARVETLMDAAPGSTQAEELELVSLLVEKYEADHFPIDPPDPVEAILFRMEQQGLTATDMIQYLGSQSKVSEVLNRRRPLSLAMIRSLHRGLGIPAEVLLQQLADRETVDSILAPGDIPPLEGEYDFSQGKRGAVLPPSPGKARITLRLDADILEWFRSQADEQGSGNYQTKINQALREYILRQQLPIEELVRRIVREELALYKSD